MNFQRSVSRTKIGVLLKALVLLILVCLWNGNDYNAMAASRGVRYEFAKARMLFDRGRLAESGKILQKIIRKYPKHKASYYLIGRIYYRRGDMVKAAKYFNRGGLTFASGSDAFEYGIAMFVVKKCSKAVAGFKRVRNKFRGLANFYSGVCYIRSRRWYQAERSLRAATKLPANIASMKQRFLVEIQRRKIEEQRNGIATAVPYTPVPVPWSPPTAYQTPGLPSGPGAPDMDDLGFKKETAVVKREPPKIKRGVSTSTTVRAQYLSQTITSDRHQTGIKTVTIQGPSGGGNLQLRYDYDPNKYGRQAVLKSDFIVDVTNLNKNKTDVTYLISEDGESASASESSSTSKDKNMTYKVKPGVEFPIGEAFDIEAGALYKEVWPEYKSDFKETTMGPKGGAGIIFGDASVRVTGSSYNKEKLVETTEEISIAKTTDTSIEGSVDLGLPAGASLNVNANQTSTSNPDYGSLDGYESSLVLGGSLSKGWENLTLSLKGTQSTNTPPSGVIVNGTASEMKAVAEASLSLKFGLSATGFFEYAQIGDYYRNGLCESTENDEVVECTEEEEATGQATGVRQGYGGSLKFAPIDWGFASVSWSHKETVYTLKQTELLLDFRSKVTDYVDDIKFLIGLSYTF